MVVEEGEEQEEVDEDDREREGAKSFLGMMWPG